MLEWTGERFVPWVDDPALAYEHLHRYAFAEAFSKGKRVLDLGSGEGYGSAMLARSAESVVGVDIDSNAVSHARNKYSKPNLRFVCGSAAAVPLKAQFDVIVCFETLEHIEEHAALVGEARRLLAPDGVFLVSTPDKRAYSDEPHHDNAFHVKELYFEEFRDLVGSVFPEARMFAQRVSAGSRIWPLGSEGAGKPRHVVVQASEEGLDVAPSTAGVPVYFLAVAGVSVPPTPEGSVLVDASDTLLKTHAREVTRRLEEIRSVKQDKAEALAWRESQIADLKKALAWRESQVADLERARATQEAEAREYTRKLESEISDKNSHIASIETMLRSETERADLAERTIFRKTLDWIRTKLAGRTPGGSADGHGTGHSER